MPKSATQTRLLFLMGALLLIHLLVAGGWVLQTRSEAQSLTADFQQEKQRFTEQIVTLKASRLSGYVYETSYWDELVGFVRTKNQVWAEESLISGAQAAGGSGLWVLDRDGQTLLAWTARQEGTSAPTLPVASFCRTLRERHLDRWFAQTPEGTWELHGATIHPSNDPAHSGTSHGFLLVGKLWSPAYLAELSKAARCQLSLTPVPAPSGLSQIALTLPLRNPAGNPAATLYGSATNPLAPTLLRSAQSAFVVLLVGFALLLPLTLLALHRWLNQPLQALIQALHERSATPLEPLLAENTEFGTLALLVHESLLQEQLQLQERQVLEAGLQERTQQLAYSAFHDALTGLPNRTQFQESLERALARAQLRPQALAVLFVDLDNFKLVNESLGHRAGDALLCAVSARLLSTLAPTDTLARFSGDQFAILLEGASRTPQVVARQLIDALSAPLEIDGHVFGVTLSVGGAVRVAQEPAAELLRNADTALHQAKAQGKSTYVAFDSVLKRQADNRLTLEADLRDALAHRGGPLYLVFQPIINLETNQLVEVEALIRWDHPTRGTIAPLEFIPLAEETGLIVELTTWVLQSACRAMAEWTHAYPTLPHLRVSVNLSGLFVERTNLVDEVLRCLHETGLAPQQLVLELTESVMTSSPEVVALHLTQLRALGVQVAIDDFGMGYSSLSTLASLPIDTIKIDRFFVSRCGEDRDALRILRAMVGLAHELQISVVSEGIETYFQRKSLAQMGSHFGQGFLFSKPLKPDAIERLLSELSGYASASLPSDPSAPHQRAWGGASEQRALLPSLREAA